MGGHPGAIRQGPTGHVRDFFLGSNTKEFASGCNRWSILLQPRDKMEVLVTLYLIGQRQGQRFAGTVTQGHRYRRLLFLFSYMFASAFATT
jgi:hypothetical protein